MNDCDRRALRTVASGREDLAPGSHRPRHRHLEPYATVVVRGRFEQVSYGGRVTVGAGDVLIQPALDCHANQMHSAGAQILRLPWHDVDELGGRYALVDVDAIVRAAERDLGEAAHLVGADCRGAPPRPVARDLPDLLAADLAAGRVARLSRWAAEVGVARETASRAFSSAYGVSARRFRLELRAREAWLRIVRSVDDLADVALTTGFADQAHMTRSVRALTGASPVAWRRDRRADVFRRARPPS